jgi:hypothetical protein
LGLRGAQGNLNSPKKYRTIVNHHI